MQKLSLLNKTLTEISLERLEMSVTMATHLSSSFHLNPHFQTSQAKSPAMFYQPNPHRHHRIGLRTRAMGNSGDALGDFGARDPFPAEVESQFGDKVLGFSSTEHKILIPNVSAFSLAQLDCDTSVSSSLQQPISEEDAQKLLRKIIGWRLLNEGGGLKLQCLWKLKDYKCGIQLIDRIWTVIEPTGHFPNLHLENPNQVRAELWTSSIGDLSMNDFIVAAKIDAIKTSDLVPRKRVWA